MNRKVTFILLVTVFFTVELLFAAAAAEESNTPSISSILSTPDYIRNNEYYVESLRLVKLAEDTYNYGDYDASFGFAAEAIRYARLSDELIATQLIDEAKRLLDLADSGSIAEQHSDEYSEGKNYYEASLEAKSNEDWEEAIDTAGSAVEVLSSIGNNGPLASQYRVKPWASSGDCLWSIAGYSFIYGDPEKWSVLYNANKSKMPEPDNPNLLEPGMVLDVPSISGEVRQGIQ